MAVEDMYSDEHRALQDRFDTRRVADLLAGFAAPAIDDAARTFIESRPFFFLSTVDPEGRPTVSYKGGAPGFVRVLDDRTLAFPSYDGNGMYLSMGNISATAKIGLLFIDFETPHRIRMHATATVSPEDPLLGEWPGAELVVRATVDAAFVNCPRYIHKHELVETSRYVPDDAGDAPLASWKRMDLMQPFLPAKDQGRAEAEGGVIDVEEYGRLVGEGTA
jgi:predicted pyridoxine 5'-phosphate oxidase superfamily flavin-nucleotide-binding protein